MDKALPTHLSDFVDESSYHQIVEDMLHQAKKLGATDAEVDLGASIGLDITVRKAETETLEFNRDKAIGLTVYVGKRKGSASTTDIKPNSITSTVEAAINLAKLSEEDPFAGLASKEEMAQIHSSLDLYHPWDLSVNDAIEVAKICEQNALAYDKRISNSEGATINSTHAYHVYANSHGFLGFLPSTRHSLSCTVIAKTLQGMERDYQYTLSRNAQELVSAPQIGTEAAQRTLKKLNARKIATQQVPVLYEASIASGLISHFMAAISGGRLFRQSSFLVDSLDKKIFQDFVHIYERPHIMRGLNSSYFDNDGVATFDKDFVREGIVKSYILSAYSARKLGMPNTANAGGVHNLFVEPGKENFNELIKKMHKGVIVTELMGQGVNLVTGDYSRGFSGFWVENGEIQYPLHEMTVAGNLRTIFKNLVAVGNDVDKRSNIQTGSLLIEQMIVAGT